MRINRDSLAQCNICARDFSRWIIQIFNEWNLYRKNCNVAEDLDPLYSWLFLPWRLYATCYKIGDEKWEFILLPVKFSFTFTNFKWVSSLFIFNVVWIIYYHLLLLFTMSNCLSNVTKEIWWVEETDESLALWYYYMLCTCNFIINFILKYNVLLLVYYFCFINICSVLFIVWGLFPWQMSCIAFAYYPYPGSLVLAEITRTPTNIVLLFYKIKKEI